MYGGDWAGERARALAPYIPRSANSVRSAMTWRMRVAYCALRARSTEHGEHDMTVITEDAAELTGGCQCGAVRYQLLTPPEHACICHCRMCQRTSGQPFMAFASVKRENLRWTRGSPATFVSSNIAERNFCSGCGTPLTYHRVASGSIAVTIGSLDTPEAVRPIEQFGAESALSWIDGLRALPAKRTDDWRREYSIPHIDSR